MGSRYTAAVVTEHVGKALQQLRKRRGWSQPKLFEASGVTVDTISRIETGKHEPQPATLRSLIGALEVRRSETTHPRLLRVLDEADSGSRGGTRPTARLRELLEYVESLEGQERTDFVTGALASLQLYAAADAQGSRHATGTNATSKDER